MASQQITPGWGGQEVGDLGGCGGGGVRLGLSGGFWVPGVPAGGPAEQTAGNKAGLQRAETQSSSHTGPVSDQTGLHFIPRTAWGQWAAFFSREKAASDQHTYQKWTHTHATEPTHMHGNSCNTSSFTHTVFARRHSCTCTHTQSPWIHTASVALSSLTQKACVYLASAQNNTPLSPSYWSPLVCSSTGHPLFLLT